MNTVCFSSFHIQVMFWISKYCGFHACMWHICHKWSNEITYYSLQYVWPFVCNVSVWYPILSHGRPGAKSSFTHVILIAVNWLSVLIVLYFHVTFRIYVTGLLKQSPLLRPYWSLSFFIGLRQTLLWEKPLRGSIVCWKLVPEFSVKLSYNNFYYRK